MPIVDENGDSDKPHPSEKVPYILSLHRHVHLDTNNFSEDDWLARVFPSSVFSVLARYSIFGIARCKGGP